MKVNEGSQGEKENSVMALDRASSESQPTGLLPCQACEGTGRVMLGCAFDKPIESECPACGGRGETDQRTSVSLSRPLPRSEIESQLEKWKRRALAFQEGYKDKSFEVTALKLQLMDLRAYGADKVTARNNESLRMKLAGVRVERNEAQARVKELEQTLGA